MGGPWGDHIELESGPPLSATNRTLRVHGWKSRRPLAGDLIWVEFQSGKARLCIFEKVEYCSDPGDMFFASCYVTDIVGVREDEKPITASPSAEESK